MLPSLGIGHDCVFLQDCVLNLFRNVADEAVAKPCLDALLPFLRAGESIGTWKANHFRDLAPLQGGHVEEDRIAINASGEVLSVGAPRAVVSVARLPRGKRRAQSTLANIELPALMHMVHEIYTRVSNMPVDLKKRNLSPPVGIMATDIKHSMEGEGGDVIRDVKRRKLGK